MRRYIYNERGSWSMIGILISVAIMLILTIILMGGPQIFSAKAKLPDVNSPNFGNQRGGISGGVGGAIAVRNRALDERCADNLRQLRQGIQINFNSVDNKYPASLADVIQVSPGLSATCPVGHEPYSYDPSNGSVKCVHPGHEGF
jgi:hypothetical protein